MYASGRHTDKHISCLQAFASNHFLPIADAYGKTSQIIVLFRHQPRMLCRLAADQGRFRLQTAFRYSLYDICNLFRIVLSAGNVIQKE